MTTSGHVQQLDGEQLIGHRIFPWMKKGRDQHWRIQTALKKAIEKKNNAHKHEGFNKSGGVGSQGGVAAFRLDFQRHQKTLSGWGGKAGGGGGISWGHKLGNAASRKN